MIRYKNMTLAVTGILLAFVLLLVPGTAALAQDQPVLELQVEVQKKDVSNIYAGPELFRYQLTAETVVLGPDGNRTTLGAHVTPFMAVVKYTLPVDGDEGTPPVAVEILILADQPQ